MVFTSFADLGKVFGVNPRKRKDKPFYCRKCGAEMKHIPDTNVYLCEGKTSDGVACGNRVLAKFTA